ncbi:hypothetical protein BGW38_008162 [Lunasporangiospora selenospora]|uniref:Uncharacterized protein n=1 Tax=Lunasporangiospora selenospora TaxID=979761 RepID=A0A9P6FZ87_9FUNG|nr:hypothetical protein BGW38_008162 [Lunasporangiospora selenospora]
MKFLSILSAVSAIVCFAIMTDAQETHVTDCKSPNAHYWMDGVNCLEKIIAMGRVGGGKRAEGNLGFCKCNAGGVYYEKVASYLIEEAEYKGCKMFSASHSEDSKFGTFYSYASYECSGLN